MEAGQTRNCCEETQVAAKAAAPLPSAASTKMTSVLLMTGGMATIVSLGACGSPVGWSSSMPMPQEGTDSSLLGNRLSV
jgi:hypothetical protein